MRIGLERVAERDRDVAAYFDLPMMEKVASPTEHPIDLTVVDGGRLQILDRRGTAAESSEAEIEETGPEPPTDEPERAGQVVATTLGCLENHEERMRYHAYRCEGLPLTSCHVESTVKLFNRRV